MDLEQHRYQTWQDLHLYCDRVAGSVGLAAAFILGVASDPDATRGLVHLGIAMQLSNILQDIGNDIAKGRIYLPLEDLRRWNYTEQELCQSIINRRWIALMNEEIERALCLYKQAETGIARLPLHVRWPLWMALIRYRLELKAIKRSHYQVFRDRPTTPIYWKAEALLLACWKTIHPA